MSDEERRAPRSGMDELLQNAAEGELPEGTMLIGWIAVAEWVDPEGNRMLTMMDAVSPSGRMPDWQRDGYLISALKGGWAIE